MQWLKTAQIITFPQVISLMRVALCYNQGLGRATFLSGGPRRDSAFLTFPPSRTTCNHWIIATFHEPPMALYIL